MSHPSLSNERLIIHGRKPTSTPLETFRVSDATWPQSGERGIVISGRRHASLVDLKFTLFGYHCVKPPRPPSPQPDDRPRIPRIERIPRYRKPFILVVEFPPQHLAETIVSDSSSLPGTMNARLSRPSRIAFDIPAQVGWDRFTLELVHLTDWSRLAPRVHDRARSKLADRYEEQLTEAFGSSDLSKLEFAEAVERIRKTLTEPDSRETSLELAGRLLLSPAEAKGVWIRSEGEPSAWDRSPGAPALRQTSAPLWSARLGRDGRHSVRAVWSSRFQPKTLQKFPEPTQGGSIPSPDTDESGPDGTPMLSLSPRDHWEIVGQTSVYGLPALRRLKPPSSDAEKLDEAPHGGVVRPERTIRFVKEIDEAMGYINQDTGIAVAAPFRDANVLLTALGASFAAEWKGEPPLLLPLAKDDGKLPRPWSGFSLERLAYRSWLGRDSEVVAVYKGYLFPLGIRASKIIVHKRQIKDVGGKGPVSCLVRQEFIVCPSRPKVYPGPYHPNDARDFPVRTVRMKTRLTPVLDYEQVVPGGHEHAPPPGEAVWPLIKGAEGTSSDFLFEWATDDAPSVKSPLIWLLNDVVARPRAIEAVVNQYRAEENAHRRVATFAGARQRYAEPKDQEEDDTAKIDPVDTRFDTDVWHLGVQGRADGGTAADQMYKMDGRMEGADQPPFFPLVEKALVGIQSLDQIMQSPQGRYWVSHTREYVARNWHGGEVYLRLLEGADMAAKEQTQSTGALAGQDLVIGGISRKIGLVGGKREPSLTGGGGEINISQAELGKFDPSQFFGEMKILGILDLKDLLSRTTDLDEAPKLVERSAYGAAEGGLALLRSAATEAHETLYGVDGVEHGLREWIEEELPDTGGLTVGNLYPRLSHAILALVEGLKQPLKDLAAAQRPDQVLGPARTALALIKPVVKEAERTLADPIPEQLSEAFSRMRGLVAAVVEAPAEALGEMAEELPQLAIQWLERAFCEAVEQAKLGAALFGRDLTCADLANPAQALKEFETGLFAEVLEPVEEALALLSLWRDYRNAVLALLPDALDSIAKEVLVYAIGVIEARLKPLDVTDLADVRTVQRQAEFARAIAAELEAIVSLPPDADLRATGAHVANLPKALRDWAASGLQAELARLRDGLRPIAQDQLDRLQQRLAETLTAEIQRRMVTPMGNAAERLELRLKALRGNALDLLADQLGKALDVLLDGLDLARIARLGAELCDDVNGATEALANGLVGEIAVVRRDVLKPLLDTAKDLRSTGSPSDPVLHALDKLIAEAERLDGWLSAFHSGFQADLCANPGPSLKRLGEFARLRRDAAGALRRIAGEARTLAELLSGGDLVKLAAINAGCARLYLDLTPIARVGVDAAWTVVTAAVEQTIQVVGSIESYKEQLEAALQAAAGRAHSLRLALQKPDISADDLLTEADNIERFLGTVDRDLSGRLLQTVAFSNGVLDRIEEAGAETITSFAQGAGGLMASLYDLLIAAIDGLKAALGGQEEALRILRYATGVNTLELLERVRTDLKEEAEELRTVSDPTMAGDLAKRFVKRTDALHKAAAALRQLAMTNFGQVFLEKVKGQLQRLRDEVTDLARQIVPVSLTTSFEWKTDIPAFPPSNPIFKMADDAGKPHLKLTSMFSFNVATAKATSKVEGELQPFDLIIVSKRFEAATLHFAPTTFLSINGASPRFDMKVANVTIGPFLEFLQPLQEWLAPQGSGFYLKFLGGGVEAGYVYDAGIIQVGSLQFINVAFGVAARLFFDGKAAEFVFKLASPDRPFLISNPPYGGGGFVELVCTADGLKKAVISFVFGGVSALKFGPLQAQGRVVAGIEISLSKQEIATGVERDVLKLTAIFEAVGEGSIACFSISVSIRILLIHEDGRLSGSTEYRFTFKIGWAKFRYRVTATYELSGGGSRRSAEPLLVAAASPFAYTSHIKRKSQHWADYHRAFDFSLVS